jgi:predicted DNA-binding protein (UPF0251 family)
MPRPRKCRRVEFIPGATYFKPAGIPLRLLEEVIVSVEEAEAVRLKDLEGLGQEEAARRMGISRATFQRILAAARQKTAAALLHGRAIKIEGGDFEMTRRRFRCNNGHEWDLPSETAAATELCPTCNTESVIAGDGRNGGGER